MVEPATMAERRAQEGFTLIELMVVVAIIAVVAAAAAPAIGAAVRDRKASTATLDVVRAFRGARAAAAGYGRAYVVSFVQANQGGQGDLTVSRGDTNRCNSSNWLAAQPVPDLAYSPVRHGVSSDFEIVLASAAFPTALDVCYEPSGATYWRAGAGGGRFTQASPPFDSGTGSGFRFTVRRMVDGAEEGVRRYVVVPLGGSPRVAR